MRMKMIDLRPSPACSESYRRKNSLFSQNSIILAKKTLHHKFSSFKSSYNGKRLYLRILLYYTRQTFHRDRDCDRFICSKHASAVVHLSSAINTFAQQYSAQFVICAMQNRQICVSSIRVQ